MNLHIHVDKVIVHGDAETDRKLDMILAKLGIIQAQEIHVAADLTALAAEVQENTDAAASVRAVVDNLVEELRTNANDPAAINALADQLANNNDALAAAVVAGTPAAPDA